MAENDKSQSVTKLINSYININIVYSHIDFSSVCGEKTGCPHRMLLLIKKLQIKVLFFLQI